MAGEDQGSGHKRRIPEKAEETGQKETEPEVEAPGTTRTEKPRSPQRRNKITAQKDPSTWAVTAGNLPAAKSKEIHVNEIDRIRFSRRGEAFQQAQQMKADAIEAMRDQLGIVKATQKASEDVSDWLREQYEAIERELPN